jgi:hypothetical protein
LDFGLAFFGRIFAGVGCGMMLFAWKRNGNHAPRIQEKVGFEGCQMGRPAVEK